MTEATPDGRDYVTPDVRDSVTPDVRDPVTPDVRDPVTPDVRDPVTPDVRDPVIAVLDYGIGNLRSAEKALQHLGAHAALMADPDQAAQADAVVLPGVGNFGRCMSALRRSGLDRVAQEAVATGKPFIGICVGMQMLYDGSEESPDIAGLGLVPGLVQLLPAGVKRPQMQWNRLDVSASPMFDGLGPEPWVYFVHSYAPPPGPHVVATCEYGGPVVAAIARDRMWATQFHPEKSGPTGMALLSNFVSMARSWICIRQ